MTNVQCNTLQSPAVGASQSALDGIARLARLPLAILETLLVWQERDQQRRHLAALDDRLLGRRSPRRRLRLGSLRAGRARPKCPPEPTARPNHRLVQRAPSKYVFVS